MSVDIQSNITTLQADVSAKIPIALRMILDAIDAEANEFTPKDTGSLRNNKLKQVLGNHASIIWMQQYAGAQEAGQMTVHKQRPVKLRDGSWITLKPGVHIFKNYTTKGTGPHYAENAVKTVVRDSERYFRAVGI